MKFTEILKMISESKKDAWILKTGKNEFRLIVDGNTVFTGKSQKECMDYVKENDIKCKIDYSDKM